MAVTLFITRLFFISNVCLLQYNIPNTVLLAFLIVILKTCICWFTDSLIHWLEISDVYSILLWKDLLMQSSNWFRYCIYCTVSSFISYFSHIVILHSMNSILPTAWLSLWKLSQCLSPIKAMTFFTVTLKQSWKQKGVNELVLRVV